MTRIPTVPEGTGGPLVRTTYRQTRRRLGRVVEPVKVYAHHPKLMVGWGMLELATERSDHVPRRLKELGVLRAAMLAGCEWCLDFGSHLSTTAGGLSEAELRALPDYRDADVFSDLEKLVLDYATGMSQTPVDVSDELFNALREHFDEPQLVELTSEIALENYRARFNWAFGIGSEGAYCVRPAATADQAASAVAN